MIWCNRHLHSTPSQSHTYTHAHRIYIISKSECILSSATEDSNVVRQESDDLKQEKGKKRFMTLWKLCQQDKRLVIKLKAETTDLFFFLHALAAASQEAVSLPRMRASEQTNVCVCVANELSFEISDQSDDFGKRTENNIHKPSKWPNAIQFSRH